MLELPDPQWYLDNVLVHARPGVSEPTDQGRARSWQRWWHALAATDDPILVAAAGQGFVLTPAQLRGLGVSRSTQRTRVRRGEWGVPMLGTVAPADVTPGAADRFDIARRQHALVAAGAALCRPGHTVGGRSAAVLHGLPTLEVPVPAELTAPGEAGLGRDASCHSFGAALAERSVERWFGVRVTDCARTVVDLARHDRRDGLMAADAALYERLIDRPALDRALIDAIGWPGVRQARAIVELATPLAESPLESLVRLALHDDGLPAPELQRIVAGYRVDMLWPDARLILEIDGLGKYGGPARSAEKRREQHLRRHGYRVERVTWDDLRHHWPETVAILRSALRP